ncbi:hypothetical protein I6J77_06510 [Rhodanobacter sp. FDAARGOS 1247]|uniref:hypothetical protein n=1 Tax=Rhodanobacter sp. FDAARGOS 1247 TaxID=2778082 RepID=UPI0019513BA4|nr:hypothetical protein [Rhodanobacter sp. FDAARGOS 1247]QRP65083.1 hypothetical protein I6J77_06510 [Rhodanobacter sp. FDAARGOS 1247]
MSHLSPALYATLAEIAPDLHVQCVDPWCVIGSTAALLLGAQTSAADVDVLTSRADAERLMAHWAARRESAFAPPDDDRFRSHFARFRFPGAPVDVMGALELHVDEYWQPVLPGKLVLAGVNGLAVPVPSVDDQIRLLESFGREKDAPRVAALRALAAPAFSVPVVSLH